MDNLTDKQKPCVKSGGDSPSLFTYALTPPPPPGDIARYKAVHLRISEYLLVEVDESNQAADARERDSWSSLHRPVD